MIIDVHSHGFPDAIATRAMNGMCRMTEGLLWPTGDGSLQNHLDHLDLAGVDKAVSCQIATKPKLKNVCGLKFIAAHLGGCDGYPWTHYPEAIAWVKSLRDPKDWDAIFGGNACRLLVLA